MEKTMSVLRANTVPADVLKEWKIRKEQDDIQLIADKFNIHRNTVSRAFKGKAQPMLIQLINSYYGIQTGTAA